MVGGMHILELITLEFFLVESEALAHYILLTDSDGPATTKVVCENYSTVHCRIDIVMLLIDNNTFIYHEHSKINDFIHRVPLVC
jgi:hypothetical protein